MRTLSERFWSKADRRSSAECWPWMASVNHNGYGKFGAHKTMVRAHRMAWELAIGPVPDGMLVCHRCDNRRCVNPAHLFLGTPKDNTNDMLTKGRQRIVPVRGEQQGQAKLTEDAVRLIRSLHESGVSLTALGRRYGVTPTAISHVVRRKNWRHVS